MPLILVWPAPGHRASDVRAALAGVDDDVLLAGWDRADADGGRTTLLASLREARNRLATTADDPEGLTLVGIGPGAVAAAGLTRYAKRLGIGLGRVIAVNADWNEPDPFSGHLLTEIPEQVELVAEDYLLATTLRRT